MNIIEKNRILAKIKYINHFNYDEFFNYMKFIFRPFSFSFSLFLSILYSSILVFSFYSYSAETLRFVINAPGVSPYIYYDKDQSNYQGVVIDFFESFDKNNAFDVQYVDSTRARNENIVYTKQADFFLGSSIWLEEPHKFIYSNTLMSHISFMYAAKKFDVPFIPENHNNALICTRRGFSYPYLQPYFNDKKLIRIDSISQKTMARMLSKGRCDFAIMSEETARTIMFSSEFCEYEFYESPMPITVDKIGFVMGNQLTEERDKINKQISVFIRSGERDKSIKKHIKPQKFPKNTCKNN